MNDWAFFVTDDAVKALGDPEDGTEIRRARLYMSGEVYHNVIFKTQFDFEGGDATFKDVWLGLKDVPVLGKVQIGHFKAPFSLEELTSSKYITFMERALPNVFAVGRKTGVGFMQAGDVGSIAASVFRMTDDYGNSEVEGDFGVAVRGTLVPVNQDSALVHVGASFAHLDIDMVDYAQRPEAHLSEKFASTGDIGTDDGVQLVGAEAAAVFGPLSVQAEYIASFVNPTFYGFYVYGSYFLTGESRAYKSSAAAFDRVKPLSNFGGEAGGPGAWELAARLSHLDLDDDDVDGGKLTDVTIGVNWYLNPNTRFMFNYVLSDVDAVDELAHAFQMRFQIDF